MHLDVLGSTLCDVHTARTTRPHAVRTHQLHVYVRNRHMWKTILRRCTSRPQQADSRLEPMARNFKYLLQTEARRQSEGEDIKATFPSEGEGVLQGVGGLQGGRKAPLPNSLGEFVYRVCALHVQHRGR